jgi:hypothetical protein
MSNRPGRNPLILPALLLLLFGCVDQTSRLDPGIIRAFESGVMRLSIAIEPLDDGYSPFYRASLVDESELAHRIGEASSGAPLPDDSATLLESVEYRWRIDGADAGDSREIFIAGTEPGRRTVALTLSLGRKTLYTTRITVDILAVAPHRPGSTVYITLSEPGSYFAVPGEVTGLVGDVLGGERLVAIPGAGDATVLRADDDGFYLVESALGDTRFRTSVFVSPVPSYHIGREDLEWYFTQFRTNTTSNCGPTIVSMGIAWAKGDIVPVASVRSQIGWTGTGAVSIEELASVLESHGVLQRVRTVASVDEILATLEEGHLVGVVYDMAGIGTAADPATDLFGQYYVDAGGHYLLLKGYSLDRRHFIVYDPIPSDWVANSERYGDGVSMYGKNRYYPVDELFAALRTRKILEIIR